jgi:hypothetical protein
MVCVFAKEWRLERLRVEKRMWDEGSAAMF